MEDSIKDKNYSSPLLSVEPNDINSFLRKLRFKYWETLFKDERFISGMTNNLYQKYSSLITELQEYDFSYYNIKKMQLKINQERIAGIEETILDVFDLFTKYYWFPECTKNVHYYNGWATNNAAIVQPKVIIRTDIWNELWKNYELATGIKGYKCYTTLSDIEKVFNYLTGVYMGDDSLLKTLTEAEKRQEIKNIETKYIKLTFYKKGSCHIQFKDLEALKKLNVFAGQKRGWLPYSYGRKQYWDMDQRERDIVDSFEGEDSYKKVMLTPEKYILKLDEHLIAKRPLWGLFYLNIFISFYIQMKRKEK